MSKPSGRTARQAVGPAHTHGPRREAATRDQSPPIRCLATASPGVAKQPPHLSGAPPKVTRKLVAGPELGGRKAAGEGQSRLGGCVGCRSCKRMSTDSSTGVVGSGQRGPLYTVSSPSTPRVHSRPEERTTPDDRFSNTQACGSCSPLILQEPPNSPRAG